MRLCCREIAYDENDQEKGTEASITLKPMMHIAFSPISTKFINFLPHFRKIYVVWLNLRFLLPPIFTVIHLCIVLYAYRTPLEREQLLKPKQRTLFILRTLF